MAAIPQPDAPTTNAGVATAPPSSSGPREFDALHDLLLKAYPQHFELPRRILLRLRDVNGTVPLRELCRLAAKATGLEKTGAFKEEDYLMLVAHAISLTRRTSLEAYRGGRNPGGYWIHRVERDTALDSVVGWDAEPAKMKAFIDAEPEAVSGMPR